MAEELMENTKGRPCVVCGNLTDTTEDIPDHEVLCILHWFDDDYSEPWERDDEE